MGNFQTIHRQTVPVGQYFKAPFNVSFGYQDQRGDFSVWFPSGPQDTHEYIVIGTGHSTPDDRRFELVDSVVLPDAFTVFHLCRVLGEVVS